MLRYPETENSYEFKPVNKIPDKYPWKELNVRATYETMECEIITQPDINSNKFLGCEKLTKLTNIENLMTQLSFVRTLGYTNRKLNYDCLKPINDDELKMPMLRRCDGRLSSPWFRPLERMSSNPQ